MADMDSGNNSGGSMQSSSTGNCDEEYDDSRVHNSNSISALFNAGNSNSDPTSHVGPMPNPPLLLLPSSFSSSTSVYHHHHDSLFTNLFDHQSLMKSAPFNTNANSFVNLDMVWGRDLRSDDQNCTDLGDLMGSSSSTQEPFRGSSAFQDMHAAQTVQESVQMASVSAHHDQNNINRKDVKNCGRNPKKRSRASRRAPTTVLTTDTNNFRAMVQEFTGIPAQPFTSSGLLRSRLDLFGTSSSALRSGGFDILRPFAQKVHPPPFVGSGLSSSTSSLFGSFKTDAITSTAVTTTANNTSNSQFGYQNQMHFDLGLLKQQQSQNFLNTNMQNHALNFQPLLQGPPRYPLSSTAQASDHAQLEGMVILEDQVHAQNLGGLQSVVSSEGWGDDGDRGLLKSIN